jgi:hydroxymethylpyrimidine/phosphomethylpyrimidine kinase
MASRIPVILCFSGHDPTGGAGLQADIEAITAQGAHAAGLITAHTVQDTRDVRRCVPVDAQLLANQIEVLLEDCRIDAIKIGLLGAPALIPLIAHTIKRCGVPVVLDPVLRAGGGAELSSPGMIEALQRELLPLIDLITPNAAEARRLAPRAGNLEGCAQALLGTGTRHVLITGGDEPDADVINTWWTVGQAPRVWRWPRLPLTFHGAGCTLAAASAALLGRGLPMAEALEQAQTYVQRTLSKAVEIGHGRLIPRRLP